MLGGRILEILSDLAIISDLDLATMYPIHDLEPEVLIYIFQLVVHTPTSLEGADHSIKPGIASHFSSSFTPLTLSHVCKAWRSLSFSLQELWSTIYVTNGAHGHIPLFQLWLQNSRNYPLKLIFRDTDGISSKNGPAILKMVEISTNFSTRWKVFKIRISRGRSTGVQLDATAMATFFRGLPTPQLQSLAFSFHSFGSDFNEAWKGLAQNSPVLKEMQVWATWACFRPIISAFPLHRLTTLSLFCIMVAKDEVLLHLGKCTSLEHLSISFLDSWVGVPQLKMVTLQRLANLTLVGHLSTIPVMNNLRLPSLSNLSLHINGPIGDCQEEEQSIKISVEKMLTRSSARLKAFTLIEAKEQFELIWLSLLIHPSLQSVEELELAGVGDNVFLEALTVPDLEDPSAQSLGDAQCPLPQLRRIHLVAYEFGETQNSLSKMVLSRIKEPSAVARIRSVSANFTNLEELRSEGEFWDGKPELELVEHRFRRLKASPLPEPVVDDFSMLEDWR